MSESSHRDEARRGILEHVKSRLVRLHSAALVGGAMHEEYLRSLGVCESRIFRGYDAIDNEHFAAGAAKARENSVEVRRQIGVPENYFLASARFIEKKNILTVIEAYATYRNLKRELSGGAPWSLVILGNGILAPVIRARIHQLNLGDCVFLPGFQQYPELPAFYGLAHAFVHGSTSEQWGLVVNEAMASSLPVLVSSHCGCASELVHDGLNGFTFDPGDKGELGNLMMRMDSGSCDLIAMGAESRKIVENFGPESFAKGLFDAAKRAQEVGPPTPGFFTRALIQALARLH